LHNAHSAEDRCRRERPRVGAVYYIQIRKSEQRPPLHLRTADLVPQPRTPLFRVRTPSMPRQNNTRQINMPTKLCHLLESIAAGKVLCTAPLASSSSPRTASASDGRGSGTVCVLVQCGCWGSSSRTWRAAPQLQVQTVTNCTYRRLQDRARWSLVCIYKTACGQTLEHERDRGHSDNFPNCIRACDAAQPGARTSTRRPPPRHSARRRSSARRASNAKGK